MILVLDKFETISGNRVHTEAKRKSISTFFVIHDSIHHSLRWERIIKISTIVFPNPPASPTTWKPHETMRLDFFPPVRASFFTSSRLESSDVMICRERSKRRTFEMPDKCQTRNTCVSFPVRR